MALTRPRGGWRYEHLPELPGDTRYEIIDGELYEKASPTWVHQALLTAFAFLLRPSAAVHGGHLFVAPLDLFLAGGRPVQPDIVYYPPTWSGRLTDRGTGGVPELIVEILSPSTREHDRERKRALYEGAGVREYWLVDPEARVIQVLVLRERGYELLVRAEGAREARSAVFPELRLAVEVAFAEVDRLRALGMER